VSAPAFVAAVTGRTVHQCFQLDGQTIHLADVRIHRLPSPTVAAVQKDYGVTVVFHKRNAGSAATPAPDTLVHPGDTLVVAASIDRMHQLEEANRG
jgi:Trk K+ transport system NAD-binding subunit